MEPLGSQLPIYTKTARAIAPQNRFVVSADGTGASTPSGSDRSNDAARGANSVFDGLRGALGNAGDLLSRASQDVSRIGDALDQIDALVTVAEENPDLSKQQRAQITAQISDYLTEIDDISANSNFENKNLLAEDQTITLQVGSGTSPGNQIDVALFASGADDLASGLSSIDLAEDGGVANARSLVDAAQDAVRDRQTSLEADRGRVAIAQDQNRISQAASDNVLQAQLAASQENTAALTQARISENLQAYLGTIAAKLEDQAVTVGGFGLPEPQAEPEPKPASQSPQPPQQRDDPYAFDPLAAKDEPQEPVFEFGPSPATSGPFGGGVAGGSQPAFAGYNAGATGTSVNTGGASGGSPGGTSGGSTNWVSIEA